MIDSHQHFWTTRRSDYGWLSPDDGVLYRDFSPQDLAPLLERAEITSTVLVQAAPSVAETRYLLDIAERTEWVAAVVGWAPLDSPSIDGELDELARHPALRGIRPMIQDVPDDEWMLRADLAPGLRALAERGLCFDALVLPRHLAPLIALLQRHPELRVVVDHAAKPEIRGKPETRAKRLGDWSQGMTRIARETGAFCKLSGLVTEADPSWQIEDLRPVVDHLIDCFGPERLMWGSDWPVVELAGGFERWRAASLELLSDLKQDERAAILGGTAQRFYGLQDR